MGHFVYAYDVINKSNFFFNFFIKIFENKWSFIKYISSNIKKNSDQLSYQKKYDSPMW